MMIRTSLRKSPKHLLLMMCAMLASATVSAQDVNEKPDASNDEKSIADEEQSAPEWHRAIVKLEYPGSKESPFTGIIVKADETTAYVLSLMEFRRGGGDGDGRINVPPQVTLLTPDGRDVILPCSPSGYSLHHTFEFGGLGHTGPSLYFALFEVVHDGLKLPSLTLADRVPEREEVKFAVTRYWRTEKQKFSTQVRPVEMAGVMDLSVDFWGKVRVTNSLPSPSVLVVLSSEGQIVGFGTSEGGVVDIDGRFVSSQLPAEVTVTSFACTVDRASQLQDLGLHISEQSLKLQRQRLRTYSDHHLRPSSGLRLSISWSDDHRELHGFSAELGEWAKLSVDEQDVFQPVLGERVAAVPLKGAIAAYSATKGVWDVLTLPEDVNGVPSVTKEVVTLQFGKQHYTFAASSGRWTSPTDTADTTAKSEPGTAPTATQPASNPGDEVPNEKLASLRPLVRVTYSDNPVQGLTGIIMKSDKKKALILTTWEYRGDDSPNQIMLNSECSVTVRDANGKLHQLSGSVVGGRFFTPMFMARGLGLSTYLVVVEAQHDGLELNSVAISDTVPEPGDTVLTISRRWDRDTDASPVTEGKIFGAVDAAKRTELIAEVSGSPLWQEGLLTIHNEAGDCIGIAATKGILSTHGSGYGGDPGQFSNLASGTGNRPAQPLNFTLVVDVASELRDLGLPVSDAALKLQTQRQRIHSDTFVRPVRSNWLMVSWSDDHRQLHGFSTELGTWNKISIDEQDVFHPILDDRVAAVPLKGAVAAYSATKGVWDVLTLPEGVNGVPSVTKEVVTLQFGKQHYTFAASSGRWTSPTDDSLTMERREFFTSYLEPGRVWERIREALRPNVFADDAIESGTDRVERSSFFVTAPRRHLDAIDAFLQKFDTADNAKAWDAAREIPTVYVTRLFPLQHVTPQQLLPQVRDALKAAKTTRYQVSTRDLAVTASVEGMPKLAELFSQLDTPENAKLWKSASPLELRDLLSEYGSGHGSPLPGSATHNPSGPGVRAERTRDQLVPTGRSARMVMDNKPSASNLPEQQSLALAKKLRDTESVTDQQRAELTQLVEQSLEARLKQQALQVEQLRAKLRQVEKALQDRQQLKDRMIQRRVEELLDPNIEWDSVAREGSTANPLVTTSQFSTARHPSNSGARAPFTASRAVRSPMEGSTNATDGGLPVRATPIGLPGPPHVPVSKPADLPPFSQ